MNIPKTLIKREGYIEKIVPFMRKNIVKVLTGRDVSATVFFSINSWNRY